MRRPDSGGESHWVAEPSVARVSIRTGSGWRSCSWRVSSSPGPRYCPSSIIQPGVGNRNVCGCDCGRSPGGSPVTPAAPWMISPAGRPRSRSPPQHWTDSTRCPHRPEQPERIRPNERTSRIRGSGPRRHSRCRATDRGRTPIPRSPHPIRRRPGRHTGLKKDRGQRPSLRAWTGSCRLARHRVFVFSDSSHNSRRSVSVSSARTHRVRMGRPNYGAQ